MIRTKPIPEEIRDYIDYNADTGEFRWKKKTNNNRRVGSVAGCIDNGYRLIRFNKTNIMAHRIAWFLFYNEIPSFVDHINGIRDDNRIKNLRIATHSENRRNQECHRKGKLCFVETRNGVRSDTHISRFNNIYLGCYDCDCIAHTIALMYENFVNELK